MNSLLNGRKSIPLGVEDFKEIREKGWLYVDKTVLIADIIRTGSAKVKLITRPRRFGKTLNLSMLKYFFDIEGAEKNRALFNGLEIENTPYMEHFGAYPVISLTLKGMDSENIQELMPKLRDRLKGMFLDYQHLLKSPNLAEIDLYDYKEIAEGRKENITEAIKYLTGLLYRHYGKKVIILMDEYDSPIIDSYISGYYEEAIKVFRNLMSNTFKTNEYLEMGIITGVSRVSKESIFSGMNNVTVYSVLSDDFFDRFGFTSDEVSEILNAYGYSDKKEEVKRFYDGYRFGDEGVSKTDIYNPLSILKYADRGKLNPYWVNTASDDLIRNVAVKDLSRFMEVSEDLLQGVAVEGIIDDSITFKRLNSIDDLWTLLLYSGYLTPERHISYSRYFLRLPNEEVMIYFRNLLRDINLTGALRAEVFVEMLFNDFDRFKRKLNEVAHSFSYFDLNDERSYHILLVSLLAMYEGIGKNGRYEVLSNRESGEGRPDIMVIDKQSNKAVIFELKHVKNTEFKTEEQKHKNISKALADASAQIAKNKYGLDFHGNIEALPVVACGKIFYFQK